MASGWDPFSDPADETVRLNEKKSAEGRGGYENVVAAKAVASLEEPPDPWNDDTFVSLAKKAAFEKAKQEEEALKAAKELEEKKQRLPQDAQEARQHELYTARTLDAIRQSSALAAAHLETKIANSASIRIKSKSRREASERVALLFPDQCSKGLEMLKGLQDLSEVRHLCEIARDVLGFDPIDGPEFQGFYELLRGPEGWLEHTQYCQPAMYITQVAAAEKVKAIAPDVWQRCLAVAGLSLGDYAALTVADVWDFETGLRIVQCRGEAMEMAAESSLQRAISIAGLQSETLERLCAECRGSEEDVCQISQYLFADGFVCAGSADAIERLRQRAMRSKGCKQVRILKPSAAFQTPLMQMAKDELQSLLEAFEPSMRPPRRDVYMSCGEKVSAGSSPSRVIQLLLDQMTSCSRWEQSVRAMIKDGLGEFYECGPLNQLKEIMKRIDSDAYEATLALDVAPSEGQEIGRSAKLPPRWIDGGSGGASSADLSTDRALPAS